MNKLMMNCMCGLLALTFAGSAQAGRWRTTYQAANGMKIGADVSLNGSSGSYHTSQGANGWLSNIRYQGPGPGDPAGSNVVTGRWRFQNGQSGDFRFNISGSQMHGMWSYGNGSPCYPWNGSFSGGTGPDCGTGGGGLDNGGGTGFDNGGGNGFDNGGGTGFNNGGGNGFDNDGGSGFDSGDGGTGLDDGGGGLGGLLDGEWASTDGSVPSATFGNGNLDMVNRQGMAGRLKYRQVGANVISIVTQSGRVQTARIQVLNRNRFQMTINGRTQTFYRKR